MDLSRWVGGTYFVDKTGSHVKPVTVFCQKLKLNYWRAIPIKLPFIAAELPKARISPLMKSTLLHSTEYYDIRQPFLVKILDESIV